MIPDSKDTKAESGAGAHAGSSTASQVPIIVTVSATSEPNQARKNGKKSSVQTDAENALNHGEESKGQQPSTSGSIDPSASADEIEVQFKGEMEEYSSLAQLNSHSSHHVLFANERAIGGSRYQLPESRVSNKGKVINFVDTYNQPQCMRFCPSLSSSDV